MLKMIECGLARIQSLTTKLGIRLTPDVNLLFSFQDASAKTSACWKTEATLN
ncbi:unnamed protein product [Acanthoscelides obtectus]|uniref:Uncharacterized protein n=1 Tax=Acanthoscelides obtectus TaxID=200917 RepID=A0A9P0LMU3_ACAOB|nr:unnamed protein product [Acanthoscelides obtectus]CAK1656564.1 hypothetical protein AOBTE_LOCUS19805 [Acanthoscelides obtectus]